MTTNNLAVLLHSQGRAEEAQGLWKRTLDIFQNALGPDHPKTRRCRENCDAAAGERGST